MEKYKEHIHNTYIITKFELNLQLNVVVCNFYNIKLDIKKRHA